MRPELSCVPQGVSSPPEEPDPLVSPTPQLGSTACSVRSARRRGACMPVPGSLRPLVSGPSMRSVRASPLRGLVAAPPPPRVDRAHPVYLLRVDGHWCHV